jgi:hypothetical protein
LPPGFVTLRFDERATSFLRLEVGAKDLSARGAQLLADQRLHGVGLVAAALVVVWRIGHYVADTVAARSETRGGPQAGGPAGPSVSRWR